MTPLVNTLTLRRDLAKINFPYPENLILGFIGGSQLHGAKLEGTDDTDWYGVYVEPKEKILGLDRNDHFVFTTGGERGGNKPGDTDVCLYGLNKWAQLAAKGNPSVLHFLFAPPEYEHFVWARISLRREAFLATSHLGSFLGYANAQMSRLLNQRGQKNVNRPFLEEEHGYDTKYAMHITRLLYEAEELMSTGTITLPRPERDLLISIRNGKFKLHELTQLNNDLEIKVIKAAESSSLPAKVDRAEISEIVSDAYLRFWDYKKGEL